jgi:diguanylate cyclase (GGDEF)-like protein/PAS domain S-box-containing protein
MKTVQRPIKLVHRQWLVFALATLVVMLAAGGSLYDRRAKVTLQEQDRLLAATLVVQAILERNLKSINQSLHNVSTEFTKRVDRGALNEELRVIDDAMPMIQSMVVVDESGYIQASSRTEVRGLTRSFRDREYFRAVQEHPGADTLYVSPPFKTILGSYTVAVTRMLVGPKGDFAGVVSALIDPTYFDSILAAVLYAPHMVAAIHHSDGTVFLLAPSDRRALLGQNLADTDKVVVRVADSGQASDVYSGTARLTGDERMVAIRAARFTDLNMNYPLGVTVSRPLDDVYAPWRRDVGVVSSVTLAILLMVALALSLYQSRYRHFLANMASSKSSQLRAASVFTHTREGILITDATGRIIEVNDAFTVITGYSRDEAMGQNPRLLQSGRHDAAFYAAMWRDLTDQGYWSGELWNRRKSSEVSAHVMNINAVRDDAGVTQHYVALFSDITASKVHQNELEHLAHFDTLTGLPNRLLLGEQLRLAIGQCQLSQQMLAVAYLDLDNLKSINDTYGHEAGDAVLVAVGAGLKSALRNGDILARIGGDEFVVVLVGLSQPDDCLAVVDALLLAATLPVTLANGMDIGAADSPLEVRVSTSIGVTFFPQDDVDADVLLRHADQAMYLAKQAGKNRYHLFDVAHDAAIQSRQVALQRISVAVTAREFVLYYQPKVNMRSGQVTGAEALIRWVHPERGLLLPGSFLPGIEDHPISVVLGEWVIHCALAQMTTWHAEGLALPVSVNIGALQLQQPDFPDRLAALLAAHPDVPPRWLRLEILETSALEDIVQVSGTMRACQALGVTFALDDFGTGYSSLTYLKHLPAEVLKIDQSFVRNMTEQADDLAIVQGVIGLANVFQREVIAEGVETKSHGDMLMSIGCDLAQGYGIARPMPAHEMPAWVATWQEGAVWRA